MKVRIIIALGLVIFLLCACHQVDKNKLKHLSYLSSLQDSRKFCNGDQMNSQDYRKSITHMNVTKVVVSQYTKQQLLNKTAEIVLKLLGRSYLMQGSETNYISLKGTTAFIKPTDGWAGVSIFMCAYQPLLEVNLQRYDFVKKVVWQ